MALRGFVDKVKRTYFNNHLKTKLWFLTTVMNDRNLSSCQSSIPLPAAKPPRRADFDAILHSIPKDFIKYSQQVDASQGFDVEAGLNVGGIVDCIHPYLGPIDDPVVTEPARIAVEQHNKQQNANLKFLRVVKANRQYLSGLRYYITLEAINAGVKNTYQAKILLNAEKCVWDLELFRLADDNPSNLDVKKQAIEMNGENLLPRHCSQWWCKPLRTNFPFWPDFNAMPRNMPRNMPKNFIKYSQQVNASEKFDWDPCLNMGDSIYSTGGICPYLGPLDDPEITVPAQIAVEQHNKQQNANLEFVSVVKANREASCGMMYYITLEAIDDGVKNNYHAKILYNAAKRGVWELDLFRLADCSNQVINKDIRCNGDNATCYHGALLLTRMMGPLMKAMREPTV